MKKLNLTLSLAAILVFAVAAWAQGSRAAGGGQGGGMANTASGTTTGSASNQAEQNAAATHGSAIEGCVVQQGSDFYIQPTKGDKAMVRLVPQSGQDLSAYAGHKVKVHGSSQIAATGASAAPGAPVEGKNTNIKNRDIASAAQGTNVPNSVTTPDQNPPAANDALAGSGALPQGSEVTTGNGGVNFMVSSIDDISSTCNTKGSTHKNNYPESAQPPLL